MNKKIISIILCVVFAVNCFAMTASAQTSYSVSADGALTLVNRMCDHLETQTPADRITLYNFVRGYMATDAGVDYLISIADGETSVSNALVNGFVDSFGITSADKQELKFLLKLAKCVPVERRVAAFNVLSNKTAYSPATPLTGAESTAVTNIYNAFIDSTLANTLATDHNLTKEVILNFILTLAQPVVLMDDLNDSNDFEVYSLDPDFAAKIVEEFDGDSINSTTWSTAVEFVNILLGTINSSAQFTDSINADIKTVLGRADEMLYVPRASGYTGISVNLPSNLVQVIFADVVFTATVTPAGANEALIEWYVNDEKQATTGSTFTYKPAAYGQYVVYAKVTNDFGTEFTSEQRMIVATAPSTPTPTPPYRPGGYTGGTTGGGTGDGGSAPAVPGELEEIPAPSSVAYSSYSDAQNHWAKDYIEVLTSKKIMSGYGDSTVRPDIGVTREDMAVLLTRVLGLESSIASNLDIYTDHNDIQSYAKNAVYVLSERGIYLGYDDGSFKPREVLTREEIISLLARSLGDIKAKETTFTDNHAISDWSYDSIQKACAFGVVSGYPDGSVRPASDVTRGEAAVMLYNLLFRLGKI